ncbi:aminoglycoside phosphotransferase family protein [Paractinoplanes rishiriensis]|uniref:Phosphotransferase n=1 Tax=Paractinoplanes rishiriensis TaxID=1050105 RepID=A0A919K419_9ACTN|nr:aminoglycoside phosphotransferase family protein [Actinoplanes rishiriensis]GIE98442.1 phosphotransferase [Actinoplanes rishiriensis]
MTTAPRSNDWHDPQWRATANEWFAATLAALGTPATGPIEEVRVRPWSVTHRAPTAAGPRWFKANTAECAYEAGLATALAGWLPGAVLAPLAVDTARGWLITADAGPTLREVIDPDRLVETWADMLRAYAQLQRSLTVRADDLVALGVPDVRVPLLPAHLRDLLADPDVREALGPDRIAALESTEFERWCAELAADGLPASLQHDDLSDANVFPEPDDGFRFFDWGDASVAHPFGVLLASLSSAAWFLGVDRDAPELVRLRDAYLESWSDLGTQRELRRSATLACRVGRVSKALAWQRALRDPALPVGDDFRTAVPDWLAELPKPAIV